MTPDLVGCFRIGLVQIAPSFLPEPTEFSGLQAALSYAGKIHSPSSHSGSTLRSIPCAWPNHSCCGMDLASAHLIGSSDGLGGSVLSSEGDRRLSFPFPVSERHRRSDGPASGAGTG